MSVSRPTARLPLKAFRLAEIPEPVRVAAAEKARAEIARAFEPDREGRPASSREGLLTLADQIAVTRLALHPPDRVYWVSQKAWDAMLERHARRRR